MLRRVIVNCVQSIRIAVRKQFSGKWTNVMLSQTSENHVLSVSVIESREIMETQSMSRTGQKSE